MNDSVTSRNAAPILSLLLMSFCSTGMSDELYVVNAAKVALYQNNRAVYVLRKGQIVAGHENEQFDGWLTVTRDDQEYGTRSQYYRSRREILRDMARDAASAEARIDRSTDQVTVNEARLAELRSAIAAAQFDSTVLYRFRVNNAFGQGGLPDVRIRHGEDTYRLPVYRYVEKLPDARARRLTVAWTEEMDGLAAETTQLRDEWFSALKSLARAKTEYRQTEERFELFETVGERCFIEPYVANRRHTSLYRRNRVVAELKGGEVVLGYPDFRYDDWLVVSRDDTRYTARTKYFDSRSKTEREYEARKVALAQRLLDIDAEHAALRDHERLLRKLTLSLEYEANVTRVPLAASPFAADFPGFRVYAAGQCPAGGVEVVDCADARRLVRNWDAELRLVQKRLVELQDQTERTRREQADLAPEFEELMRRFSALGPPTEEEGR